MKIEYKPKGTCSTNIVLRINDGVIQSAEFTGGCSGNLEGICRLVEGMNADDAYHKLKGIRCGRKPTSCPDQLAHVIDIYRTEQNDVKVDGNAN